MKHTPGPLSLLPSRTLVNIKGPRGEQICQMPINDPNAQHMIDCWNACEWINPEAVPDLVKVYKEASKLVKLLEDVIYNPPTVRFYVKEIEAAKSLLAAIAKACPERSRRATP